MWQRKKILRVAGLASLGLVLIASAFTLYLDHRVRTEFEGRRFALPARIYARPLELHAGLRLALPDLEDELRELGYKPLIEKPDPTREAEGGWYVRSGERLDGGLAGFLFLGGPPAPRARCPWRSTAAPSARSRTRKTAKWRSQGWSRCRSAASTRRAMKTASWCASRRCRRIS